MAISIRMKMQINPNLLWTFFEDIGAKILIPAGVNESMTTCENNPKNNARTISMYVILILLMKNKLTKNKGRNTISNFLFKNKKLKRAIRTAMMK